MNNNSVDGLNIFLTIVSTISTAISVYSAYKSTSYYKKSKNLITYKSINIAYVECQNIKEILSKLLILSNPETVTGINVNHSVSDYGRDMRNSINKIRENMYEKDFKDVKNLLDSNKNEIEIYIDSLISGKYVDNNLFIYDDDFNTCDTNINKIQELIKDRLDEISEKLK